MMIDGIIGVEALMYYEKLRPREIRGFKIQSYVGGRKREGKLISKYG